MNQHGTVIFCLDNIINFITASDTFLSDHCVIYAETLTPVHDSSTVQIDQNLNNATPSPPPSTRIEILDFNKSNWPKLKESLNTIDWPTTFCGTPANLYIDVAIDTISDKCNMFVPQKNRAKK